MNDTTWMHRAACRGKGTLFFGPDGERAKDRETREVEAKAICSLCPVRVPCLDSALEHFEKGGIFAGLDEDERRLEYRRRSRRARTAAA